MRKRCVIANWKMNLPPAGIDAYMRQIAGADAGAAEIVIAPPFPFLSYVHSLVESLGARAAVSAQNCSDRESGAFTGEVSAGMLRTAGAAYTIVGHSERRTLYGEDDQLVGRKMRAAAAAGLIPILCVGERDAERERGETNQVLDRQLEAALSGFDGASAPLVAYEPVWAIGTGKNATPGQAADAHRHIRSRLEGLGFSPDWPVLYGGSVTPQNAAGLARERDIDGFLVGGASLDPVKFKTIHAALDRGHGVG